MKNYFIDYEIYTNNLVTHWGNCFFSSDTEDPAQLAYEVKKEIIKSELPQVGHSNIRLRQFNSL